jgi:hypothetical protein
VQILRAGDCECNRLAALQKEDEMERRRLAMLTAGIALAWLGTSGISGATAPAQTVDLAQAAPAARVDQIAQSGARPDDTQPAPSTATAPMVKPPNSASGSNNPDNMPIKRPDEPTNDKMSRQPPASGANAK